MFCLNARQDFPIGKVFERGTFRAIIKIDGNLLRKNFDEIDFADPLIFAKMLGIYKDMCQACESDMDMIQKFESFLNLAEASPPGEIREAYQFALSDENFLSLQIRNDLDTLKRHLPQIKAANKSVLIEKMKSQFAPLHAIASGMKKAPFNSKINFAAIQRLPAKELDVLLQGQVSKEDIVQNRLVFNGILVSKQQWFKNWMMSAKDKKLELFLFAVTGSPTLGDNAQINIVDNEALAFHTCSKTLDIKCSELPDQRTLEKKLDDALRLIAQHRGFGFA